jgi:hypothetical protein
MTTPSSNAGLPPAAVGGGALHLPDAGEADDADRLDKDIAEAGPALAADPHELATDSEGPAVGSADADADARRTGGDRNAD